MLDDDHLPLGPVGLDAFLSETGEMYAHYFYDLIQWHHGASEFDDVQRATADALVPAGLELLAYASHQPQLIDKQLLREAVAWAAQEPWRPALCAWATYFNHSVTRLPTLFHKRAFRTLNWPVDPGDWSHAYEPADPLFESYSVDSYSTRPFRGLSVGDSADLKLKRKRAETTPFVRSVRMQANSAGLMRRSELMHGLIRFAAGDLQLLAGGLPQLITVARQANLRLDVSWQLLGVGRRHDVDLAYRVDGGPIRTTRIVVGATRPGRTRAAWRRWPSEGATPVSTRSSSSSRSTACLTVPPVCAISPPWSWSALGRTSAPTTRSSPRRRRGGGSPGNTSTRSPPARCCLPAGDVRPRSGR